MALSEEELPSLLEKAKNGDQDALEQLFNRLWPHIRRLAQNVAGNRGHDASDLRQEAMLKVAEKIGDLDAMTSNEFLAWIKKILANRRNDEWRRENAKKRTPAEIPTVKIPSTPSRPLKRKENAKRLEQAIDTLPEQQRNVIRRYYLEGRSYKELVQELGKSDAALRQSVSRALMRLREIISEDEING